MNLYSKQALVAFFSTQYVSPLTRLHYQIETLKRALLNQPLMVQISNPSSWLYPSTRPAVHSLTHDELCEQLALYRDYLDNPDNVFNGSYQLKQEHSIPYFEWTNTGKYYAISDFLGTYTFIGIVEQYSLNELTTFITEMHQSSRLPHPINILLFGAEAEKAQCDVLLELPYVHWIDWQCVLTEKIQLKLIISNERRLKLFSAAKPLLLINTKGKLTHCFSRQELNKPDDIIHKLFE